MHDLDLSIVDFAVYEETTDFYGMAEIAMPDIKNMTHTVSGAGIAGNVEEVILGYVDTMTMSMKFRTMTNISAKLAEPRRHRLELRAAQQITDTSTGAVRILPVKYVVQVTPKTTGLGKLAPATTADINGEYSVSYIAAYVDGQNTLEIDPYNFKYVVNGVDYLADVRNAVGK